MQIRIKQPEKTLRIITIATLAFMICYGLFVVLVQIRPFWVDEWRVIYNLKYKDPKMLWGPLDYMQQFPRVYLQIIKAFTAPFDYSYFTLRFPSFVVGTLTILLAYRIMKRLYPASHLNKFLFVLILVSSYTATEYFVQIKQYTMDILLSLVALWQLTALLRISGRETQKNSSYVWLCASFLLVPFFSYTYPVAVLPVFVVMLIKSIWLIKNSHDGENKTKQLYRIWLPLCLCIISTTIFYVVDVRQVMVDQGMKDFWQKNMMPAHFSIRFVGRCFYELFAQVGSGDLFNVIFGVLGVCSFVFAIVKCLPVVFKKEPDDIVAVRLYAVLLLLLTMVLFTAGKLPIESRLNAFSIPAIAILIIYFIEQLQLQPVRKKIAFAISAILYLGVIGNIFTSYITAIVSDEHTKKLAIYVNTENAILFAQENKLPIMITPGVTYPYEHTPNYPSYDPLPGDWVLKTYPAFNVNKNTKVLAIHTMGDIRNCISQLPPGTKAVLAGDGVSYHVVMLR